jgi:hypothetical protein
MKRGHDRRRPIDTSLLVANLSKAGREPDWRAMDWERHPPGGRPAYPCLRPTGASGMIGACGLGTHTFRVACEDARGLRAGALIAALGGLSAERTALDGHHA